MLAAILRDDALDVGRGDALIDDDGEVACRRRVLRQRLEVEALARVLHEHLEVHLEEVDLLLDAEVHGSLRVKLADGGDDLAALLEEGRLARVHGEVLAGLDRVLRNAEHAEELLDDALHVEEVDHLIPLVPADFLAAARDEAGDHQALLRQLRQWQRVRQEDRRDVEELDVVVLAREVAHGVLHDGGQEARADERRLIRQRIEDGDGLAERRVSRHEQLVEEVRAREGERELLRHAEACERVLDLVDKVLLRALLALDHAAKRRRARDLVEAVDARDFLREVLHVGAVIAPRRHGDVIRFSALCFDREAELREDLDHLLARDLRAEAALDLVRRVVDRHWLLRLRIAVDDALRDRAGAHVLQQLAGAIERARRVRHVDAALEAARGLRVQAAGARRAADARAVERSGFEHDCRRLLRDLGLEAAHDAREAGRMLGIGDDELRALREARAVVERVEVLALFGEAGRQRVARDLIVVVGVHRLAKLDHDEVRHVDDVVDGADAGTLEALLHPLRRRADLDVLDDARAEAVAEVARLDADGDHVGSLGRIVLVAGDGRPLRLVARQHRDLAHEADDAEAVAAVCRELELEHDVVEAEHVLGRHADRRVRRQDVDAVLLLLRQLREVEVELAG